MAGRRSWRPSSKISDSKIKRDQNQYFLRCKKKKRLEYQKMPSKQENIYFTSAFSHLCLFYFQILALKKWCDVAHLLTGCYISSLLIFRFNEHLKHFGFLQGWGQVDQEDRLSALLLQLCLLLLCYMGDHRSSTAPSPHHRHHRATHFYYSFILHGAAHDCHSPAACFYPDVVRHHPAYLENWGEVFSSNMSSSITHALVVAWLHWIMAIVLSLNYEILPNQNIKEALVFNMHFCFHSVYYNLYTKKG